MDSRVGGLLLLLIGVAGGDFAAASEGDCLSASKAYVSALLSHDASKVPLHPFCRRTENGLITGLTGADIAFGLEYSPLFRVIKDIRDEVYNVDNEGKVLASYLIVTKTNNFSPVFENFTCESYKGVQTLRKIVATFTIKLTM